MSRQIGEIETSVTEASTHYQIKYFVKNKDLEDYIPEIKSKATWVPGDCVVTSFQKNPLGPHWTLAITAAPRQDLNSDDPNEFVMKTYDTSEFCFDCKCWGAREASSVDVKNRILNVYGEPCDENDYLFGNATSSNKGTANYAYSPFYNSSNINTELIGQTVKTMIYCCTFYSRRNINYFADFMGVNGSFSVKCRPSITSIARWRVETQSLNNKKDANGKIWVRVSRKMMLAPEGLKWEPKKNGGIWKW